MLQHSAKHLELKSHFCVAPWPVTEKNFKSSTQPVRTMEDGNQIQTVDCVKKVVKLKLHYAACSIDCAVTT